VPLDPLVALVPELADEPLVPEEADDPDVPEEPDVPAVADEPEVPDEPSPPDAPSKLTVQKENVPEPTVLVGARNCNSPVIEL
jgi:hypothetical protein